MNKIKKVGLSMGTMCLASAMTMPGAFAMKPGQMEVSQTESTEQSTNLDHPTELEIVKAELAELKEKYDEQTAELHETKLALEMAKKKISELEKLPNRLLILRQRILDLETRIIQQERQLEEAREIIAQRDAQINQLKATNEHTHQNLRLIDQLDSITHERETIATVEKALHEEYSANIEKLTLLTRVDELLREADSERVSLQIRAMVAESQSRTETARADAAEAKVANLERQLKEASSQIISQTQQTESLSGTQKETIAELKRKLTEKDELIYSHEQKIFELQVQLKSLQESIYAMY